MGKNKVIYINEDKLPMLGEESVDLLPKFLYAHLRHHTTSLGDNPAFPPDDDYAFDYAVIKKRYKEVVKHATDKFGENILDLKVATAKMSELLHVCEEKERPIRPQLEKIVENAINRIFAIPPETVNFECQIVDRISIGFQPNVTPEAKDGHKNKFSEIADFQQSSKAVQKRRLIDSLIQGGAICLSRITKSYKSEVEKISKELPSLYKEILILSDLLLFIKKEELSDFHTMEGAFVVTKLGSEERKTEITAQGIIFPLLLQESIRGYLELFASHGLPKDKQKAQYILKHSDYLLAEPWDMRFGPELWHRMLPQSIDTNAIPYYFSAICKLPMDTFNPIMQEIFFGTEQGENFKNVLLDQVSYDADYQRFENNLNAKKVDQSVIIDGYFAGADDNAYVVDGETDDVEDDNLITDEKQLEENTEEEEFSTPDTSFVGDVSVNWGDKDAIPFFVLNDWSIEYGTPSKTHMEHYNTNHNSTKASLNDFLNSIILQGRYWKDNNIVSFWNIDSEGYTNELLRHVVSQVCDLSRPCHIAYRDKVLQVIKENDGSIWFKTVDQDDDERLIDGDLLFKLDKLWESDKNYVKNTFIVRDNIGDDFFERPITEYETFAITCYQFWSDYMRRTKYFSYPEMETFIGRKYHYRVSFKEGFDYYCQNLRNKAYGKNMSDNRSVGEYKSEGNIEDLLNSLGVSRSQYNVAYYDRTKKPYSYNIHITDKDKAKEIIDAAKSNDLVVDRANTRKLNAETGECLYTFRLRNKANDIIKEENGIDEISSNFIQDRLENTFDRDRFEAPKDWDNRILDMKHLAIDKFGDEKKSHDIGSNNYHFFKHNDEWINDNSSKKLTIFDSDYENLADLYEGVKKGLLLIHCRRLNTDDNPSILEPEVGETVQSCYGAEYAEVGREITPYIYASDDFGWTVGCLGKDRNAVCFVDASQFVRYLGDGYIQEPNGRIEFCPPDDITIESGDYFADEPVDVVAILRRD